MPPRRGRAGAWSGWSVGCSPLAGQQIATGFADLWARPPPGLDELITYLSEGPLGWTPTQIQNYLSQITDQLQANSGTLVSGALSFTTTVGHVLAGGADRAVLPLFFLKDGALIWTWLLRLLPAPSRERVHEAGRRGLVTLSAFTRTQILVASIDAVGIGLGRAASWACRWSCRSPCWCSWRASCRSSARSPPGAIAVLVALVDQGPASALIMLGVVLVVQQVEGHVLQPLLLGHAVSVHPVAVLLSVAAGSLAAGVVGALFAVPFVATLNTVVLYLHGHDKFPDLGSDADWRGRRLAALNGTGAVDETTRRSRRSPTTRRRTPVSAVTREEIVEAQRLLDGVSLRTPVEESRAVSEIVGGRVVLKCENLQRAGSFKIRGAYTRISRLSDEEKARGVVAASAGNHAQGVALAAQLLGLRSTVFMPEGAALPKIAATKQYGAQVLPRRDHRGRGARGRRASTPSAPVRCSSTRSTTRTSCAGQGTVGLEIAEQVPDVRTVDRADRRRRAGGGDRGRARPGPGVQVIGVQAAGAAAYPDSLAAGHPIPA